MGSKRRQGCIAHHIGTEGDDRGNRDVDIPHMMMKIIGRAMIAFSERLNVAFMRLNQSRKYGLLRVKKTKTAMAMKMRITSTW